jgi:hypothetical protein
MGKTGGRNPVKGVIGARAEIPDEAKGFDASRIVKFDDVLYTYLQTDHPAAGAVVVVIDEKIVPLGIRGGSRIKGPVVNPVPTITLVNLNRNGYIIQTGILHLDPYFIAVSVNRNCTHCQHEDANK